MVGMGCRRGSGGLPLPAMISGKLKGLRPELLEELEGLAAELGGRSLYVTSGFRVDSDAHRTGLECDIACEDSAERYRLVRAAILRGWCRIGVYDRHVHLGMSEDLPQCVMWHGVSQ